jgi:TP901 family phage tail tape measure protein
VASIGDIFLRMLADDSGFKADLIKKGVAAGDAAGLSMGQRMGASLGKSLNKNLGRGVSNAVNNIGRIAVSTGVMAIGGGALALKWAGDFEAQLNTINTIARETPEGLAKIGDEIRAIARETGTPLEELTQGYYDLLSAGVKAADAPKVLAEANKLAIGGLASAAEGVDLLTTAINVYGGDATKAPQYADEFAKAVERGKVTVAEIAASYAQVAPLAKSLGIENQELAAGYATLTAAGTPAAEAATQMAASLTALLKKTPALEKLEKATKKNYAAIAGSKGLNVALEEMQVDADKAGIELIDLVGRKEALLYILQTTGPNLRKYNADLAAMGDSAGTAAGQMAERQKGLNFQIARAKALFKDAGITIGTALLPKLVPLVAKFNEFVTGNQAGIKQFGTDFAGAFEKAAGWVQRLDFAAIVASLKLAGTFAKGVISAFLAAPQWLQAAVVSGWGLNKLTGGALGSIFGDLTKTALSGFLQQFVSRGSSPANPMFVADVTGGAGGLPGAAGKGGILGKLLKFAGVVGLATIALELWQNHLVPLNQDIADMTTSIDEDVKASLKSVSDDQLRVQQAALENGLNKVFGMTAGLGPLQGVLFGSQIEGLKADLALVTAELDRRNAAFGGLSPEERDALRNAPKQFGGLSPDERDQINALEAIDSTLTAMQHQLHADLAAAVDVLRTSNDPEAIAAAAAGIVAAVQGGAGSAGTTQGAIGALNAQRDAALASGNTELANTIAAAIKQLEPFAKGRQWQQEQIDEARKIIASNKTTAEKVAALKSIQQDLLSHNRTMAAGIIGELIDIEAAVKGIKFGAVVNQQGGGALPREDRPGYKPPTPPKVPAIFGGKPPDERARGGPLSAYQMALIGEEGPELWAPRVAGRVYSASQTRELLGEGGGDTTINVPIQGLIPYRDAMTIPTQLKRLRDFGVLTPRRSPVRP